jgi:hypothetical protein
LTSLAENVSIMSRAFRENMKAHTPAAALIFLVFSSPTSAQNRDVIEREGQRPRQEQSQQEAASRSSAESAKLAAPGEDVTYEQVLSDPDDVELSYRYALGQIKRGELKGSSATLERILLINPDLPKVRLLYAVVLLRLDNLIESERELRKLISLSPSANVKTEAERYLAEVRRRQKRTQLSGRLSAGLEYDDNRNATPSTDKRLFGGAPIQLTGANERRDDTSFVTLINVDARRDLGAQAGHELFASFNFYNSEQTLLKTLNLRAYSVQAGGVYKTRWGDLTPSGLFDHVSLHHRTFLRNHGGELRFDHKVNKRLGLWLDFRDVMQQYSRTEVVPTAGDRTGVQWDLTAGLDVVLTPTLRAGIAVDHGIKRAAQRYYSFERNGGTASGTVLLGKGTFALASVTVNDDRYYTPDTAITVDYRRDTTVRASGTYGAPLSLLRAGLKDFMLTLSYEYLQALSTVQNYAYTNNKIMGLLTYRWSLGL